MGTVITVDRDDGTTLDHSIEQSTDSHTGETPVVPACVPSLKMTRFDIAAVRHASGLPNVLGCRRVPRSRVFARRTLHSQTNPSFDAIRHTRRGLAGTPRRPTRGGCLED